MARRGYALFNAMTAAQTRSVQTNRTLSAMPVNAAITVRSGGSGEDTQPFRIALTRTDRPKLAA